MKTKITIFILLVAVSAIVSSCKNNDTTNHEDHNHEHHDDHKH